MENKPTWVSLYKHTGLMLKYYSYKNNNKALTAEFLKKCTTNIDIYVAILYLRTTYKVI